MRQGQHENVNYETPYLDAAVAVFALLASPVRVKIVLALQDGEMSGGLLADIADLSLEQVSGELVALESVGIIACQQEGRRDFYRLANEHAGALASNAIFHAQDRDGIHDLGRIR
ncbi:metalloregulator ArsR/SmtB family transcription factor [Microbacterium sp. SY138]|uniref:metalloregulator ArsR/SmtB family transcription factor n=1 Tax=unclassified Microbacterium TaxID=2609290 RepID=UPI00321914A4